ncbi:DUF5690 family protein [Botrimarina sp.]|uniref:DUF5690 family protein n=1 Tax=Botrimarina sp. TaxID=2795802 RepID=UPI0032ED313A
MLLDPRDSLGDRVRGRLAVAGPTAFSAYCIGAAFATYFCMYAFRKPFTAAEYDDGVLWGVGYKSVFVAAQVAGYTLSKFIGIKVIAEMPRGRRAVSILALIGVAEASLVGFALVPPPYNFPFLFVNGLPLGMVFGLVLSFLEGRRLTEALAAGLCASFIVSSGVVKSVGRWLVVDWGVDEYWMPSLAGLLFVPPLAAAVGMLSLIPPPGADDIAQRQERAPMTRAQRWAFFRRHAVGLTALIGIFVALTVLRSLRDDFAVEIWQGLGYGAAPSVFARSETLVMVGVIVISGAAVLVGDNRRALVISLGLVAAGFALVLVSLAAQTQGALGPFWFMVLIGMGAYVPYVAFHTTVFERLIALSDQRANLGYVMYLADSSGYLAYVAVMFAKGRIAGEAGFLTLFTTLAWWIAVACLALSVVLIAFYARKYRDAPAPLAGLAAERA